MEKQVRELADRLMDGCIEVRPYKMGDATPCTYCDFRSLCRFDPAQDDYLSMPPKNRAQVLEELRGALFDSAEAQDDAEVEE